MKTIYSLAFFIMSVSLSTACTKRIYVEPDPPTTTPVNGFDYRTTTQKASTISIIDFQGKPLSGITMALYYENPMQSNLNSIKTDVTPITAFGSDNGGTAQVQLSVPLDVDSVYMFIASTGFVNPYTVAVKDLTGNLIIAPAGYKGTPQVATQAQNAVPNPRNLGGNLFSLGAWNSWGVPEYSYSPSDVITPWVRAVISGAVPEYYRTPSLNPHLFQAIYSPDMNIEQDAQVWVTFLEEGAGNRSTMGYFIYPTANPPTKASQIDRQTIIFPNCSYIGSSGGLTEGFKVQLLYYNPTSKQYQTTIPAGNSVGWFLIPNGYNDDKAPKNNTSFYSINSMNPGQKQQIVAMNDPKNEKLYIAFEDTRRDSPIYGSDEDFNDAIFYVSASPQTAINTENKPSIAMPIDSDGDGVYDYQDASSADPTMAHYNYCPSKGVGGTIAFEDVWPSMGDYDFNDLVIDYNYDQIINSENKVVRIKATYIVRAVGSGSPNGFALSFGSLAPTAIRRVTGQVLGDNLFKIGGNGTEIGNPKTVVPIFDNALKLFDNQSMINVYPEKTRHAPVQIDIQIDMNSPVDPWTMGAAPFDMFLVVRGERGREIHLANQAPTAKADLALFGSGQDASNSAAGKYYLSQKGHPWAILTPVSMAYPTENSNIKNAYTHFEAWATSNGAQYPTWYAKGEGYRNSVYIYPD